MRVATKVTAEQKGLGRKIRSRESRREKIHLWFVVCFEFVDCGNDLCYLAVEMLFKVIAGNFNAVGEVNATKRRGSYRGSSAFVSLATRFSSGAPKVWTACITSSRNASGVRSPLVIRDGKCPTTSLTNASAIKSSPASMPVCLINSTIAGKEKFTKQTLRRKVFSFLKL